MISAGDSIECWKLNIPRLPHLFTGTGDLFAGIILHKVNAQNTKLTQTIVIFLSFVTCLVVA
jgi:pyridoxal/pyridoxine/pyridoxamine kinase